MNRAVIYQRISQDRDGEGLGVARQEEMNRDWVASKGYEVVASLTDNDISGFSGKDRPAWNRLQEGVRADEYDVVVVYALDRLSRRTRELLAFIDLLEEHNVRLGVVNSPIDYSTTQGRLMLGIVSTIAESEVRTKGDRHRAANKQARAMGKVHYRSRSFGWVDRERQELDPVEAEMVRTGAEAILSGATLGEVTRAWNESGVFSPIPPKKGQPHWSPSSVKNIILRPANAAIQTYEREPVGKGDWAPIFGEDVHNRLLAYYAPGRPRPTRSPSSNRAYLLSGVMRCGRCDDGRTVSGGGLTKAGKPLYQCNACRLSVHVEKADKEVLDYARDRLAALTLAQVATPDEVTESTRLSDKLLAVDAERQEIMKTEGLTSRSRALLLVDIDRRDGHLRSALEKVSRDSVLAGVVSKASDWQSLTMAQQRTLLGQIGLYTLAPGHRAKRVDITEKQPMSGGLMAPEGLAIVTDGETWEPLEHDEVTPR